MARQEYFTEEEIARMKDYELRNKIKIIYSFEEKCELYRTQNKNSLIDLARKKGLEISDLLIDDCPGPDNPWINKQLTEDLEAILKVIGEK